MDPYLLNRLPKDVVLQQTRLLNKADVKSLCRVDAIFNQRICQSTEFYQQRYEVEISSNREWLKTYFLNDERYRETVDGLIPASAFDYYAALREANLRVDPYNNDRDPRIVFIVDDPELQSIIKPVLLAIRYNFDRLVMKYIDDVIELLRSGNSDIDVLRKDLTAVTQSLLHYNRLILFQYLVERITNNDEIAMRREFFEPAYQEALRTKDEIRSTNMYLRRVITDATIPDDRLVITFPIFDQAFYDFLTGSLFDQRMSGVINDYKLALALYYDDVTQFEQMGASWERWRKRRLIVYADAVALYTAQLPLAGSSLSEELITLAEVNAHKIIAHRVGATPPGTMGNFRRDNTNNTRLLYDSDLTPFAIRQFFTSDVLKVQLPIIVANMLAYITTSDFIGNYRTILRMYVNKLTADDLYTVVMSIVNIDPTAITDTTIIMANLRILQELLRSDLVTNPRYRSYLSVLFQRIAETSYRPDKRLIVPLAYLAYVKYYYLNNQLPLQPFTFVTAMPLMIDYAQHSANNAVVLLLNNPTSTAYKTITTGELFNAAINTFRGFTFIFTGIQDKSWYEQELWTS